MALRARLLDFVLHIGLIGSSVAAALLGYGPIPSTTGMLLTTAAIVILLPFRGAWGHYLAGGVDVGSAVLAAYVLVQAMQVKPPTTTVMTVEIMSVAYVIIALVAASVIGFEVLAYDTTADWRERQQRVGKGLLEAAEVLADEQGLDVAEVRTSILQMNATLETMIRRFLMVAEAR